MVRTSAGRLIALVTAALAVSAVSAQRGPVPDPLVKENATVKLSSHAYAIPDGSVMGVPNVGIVVGSRATLVIDPGLGRRNGETVLREVAKVSKNTDLFIASTHFHAEHTTGYIAFPATAKYSQLHGTGSGVRSRRHADGPGVRRPVAPHGRDREGRGQASQGGMTFDREYLLDLGDVRVRFLVVGPTHTEGDTAFFVEGDAVLFSGDVVMNESFVTAIRPSRASRRGWRPSTRSRG